MEPENWVAVAAILGTLVGTVLGWALQTWSAATEYKRTRDDRERERWAEVKRPLYSEFIYAARAARAVILGEAVDDLTYALNESRHTAPEAAENLSRLFRELELIAPSDVTKPARRLIDLTGRVLFELAGQRARINAASTGDDHDREILTEYWQRRSDAIDLLNVVRNEMRKDLGLPVDEVTPHAEEDPRPDRCDA